VVTLSGPALEGFLIIYIYIYIYIYIMFSNDFPFMSTLLALSTDFCYKIYIYIYRLFQLDL
jgi:hypothetical protein